MRYFILLLAMLISSEAFAQAAQSGTDDRSSHVFTWQISPLVNCIKPDPTSCSTTIEVQANPCIQRIVAVSTSTVVGYTENGRADSTTFNRSWSGNDCRVVIVESLDGRVLGGTAQISVTARLSDGRTASSQKTVEMFGNNAGNDVIRQEIANSTYSAVAYDRSRFKQFAADGKPQFNAGFGVMRLTAPDAEQVWHWRRNVQAGKILLDQAWADAKAYPQKMRQNGFPRIPDFTARELKLFALQSLAAELYYVPNTNGRQWIPNKAKSDYADKLLKIETEVAAGRPPADW